MTRAPPVTCLRSLLRSFARSSSASASVVSLRINTLPWTEPLVSLLFSREDIYIERESGERGEPCFRFRHASFSSSSRFLGFRDLADLKSNS
uniref:Uncharacterized protein n=1 Tax=Leersia perrieri TaxID=77586 RepID=A0A0D9WSW4_9ORYZ